MVKIQWPPLLAHTTEVLVTDKNDRLLCLRVEVFHLRSFATISYGSEIVAETTHANEADAKAHLQAVCDADCW